MPSPPACKPARSPAKTAPALCLGLADLVVGVGVGDDAAAGLDVDAAVLDQRGADVDAGVEVAAVGQVADRAAVGTALGRLELVDDLHRADLRRSRERPGGQRRRAARPSASRPRAACPTPRRRCASRASRSRRPSARPPSPTPYSQTRPRSLRARSTSITCSARSFSSASSSSARSMSSSAVSARGRVPAIGRCSARRPVDLDQRLRRGAGDLEVAEVEEVHVRARVDGAQPAVDRERARPARRRSSAGSGRPGRRRRRGCTPCSARRPRA